MASTNITLLMWDSKENFYSKETQRNLGDNYVFKAKILFQTKEEFKKEWDKIDEDEILVFCCHYKCADGSLYNHFQYSRIKDEFNIPEVHYLSNNALKASKNYQESRKESERIIHYNTFMEKITKGEIDTFTKKSIQSSKQVLAKNTNEYPRIKYAIITALFDDEFEQLQRFFEFPQEQQIKTDTKIFYRGYLRSDKDIEIVAAIPNATGMIDSSIIATQLLEFFQPEYLLMSGVCGGSSKLNFGDIVVAKQIFTYQKGKLSDIKRKNELGEMVEIDIFNAGGTKIDPTKLFDNDGNHITLSVEKFEVEHDTIVELDSLFEDSLNPHKGSIILLYYFKYLPTYLLFDNTCQYLVFY